MTKDSEQLNTLLRERYNVLDSQNAVAILPLDLADDVYKTIDPQYIAPHLVQYAAIMELRQLARGICRERNQEQAEETENKSGFLFDMQLQPRYPAKRNDDDAYVLREYLTLEERRLNIQRLRREASAKTAHADALEAETEHLVRQGKLEEVTT